MNAATQGRRSGPLRPSGWPVLAAVWLAIAAVIIASNVFGGSGTLGLDGDVLRYDGTQVTVDVRDLGPVRPKSAVADSQGGAVYQRSAGVFATAGDKRHFYALFVGQLLAITAGTFCVVRLVRRAARRRPFDSQNVLWLRLLALVIAIGGILIPALVHRWEGAIIEDFVGNMEIPHALEPMSTGPGQAAFAVVAILLILAEVWKRGIKLQQDVEATI